MYDNVKAIIEKRIEELTTYNKEVEKDYNDGFHCNPLYISTLETYNTRRKIINELNFIKSQIDDLDEPTSPVKEPLIVGKFDMLCKLNAIQYKGGENIEEVIEWIKDNIDFRECNIGMHRNDRDAPFEYKLETPDGVIPVGSMLVKMESGKLSYIPKELFDEDIFICLEDD